VSEENCTATDGPDALKFFVCEEELNDIAMARTRTTGEKFDLAG